jgi:serine/threonine protein kinase
MREGPAAVERPEQVPLGQLRASSAPDVKNELCDMEQSCCPEKSLLKAFVLGAATPAESRVLADHLDSCERCRGILESLEETPDSLLSEVREVSEKREAVETPELQHAERGSAAQVSDELSGVGNYTFVRPLGSGGYGAVFLANDPYLKRQAAVKVLRLKHRTDPRIEARFLREMAAIGTLPPHDNIVQAYGAAKDGGLLYLAMAYHEGIDLAKLMKSRPPLAANDACEIARQACLALQHVADHGLVHRDIKPGNLLLTRTGQVKLLDLGLARLTEMPVDGEPLTDESKILGTAAYMAPEQAANPQGVDIRADLYGLGCTLFHLLTGSIPFRRPDELSTLFAHATADPPDLDAFRSDLPAGLVAAVKKFLSKEPDRRYPTPLDAAMAFEPYAQGAKLAALATGADTPFRTPISAPKQARDGRIRPRWPVAARIGGLVAMLAVLSVWFATSSPWRQDVGKEIAADVSNVPPKPPEAKPVVLTASLEPKGTSPDASSRLPKDSAPPETSVASSVPLPKPTPVRPPPAMAPPNPPKKPEPIRTLVGHESAPLTMSFAPDGKTAVSVEQLRMYVWDLAKGTMRNSCAVANGLMPPTVPLFLRDRDLVALGVNTPPNSSLRVYRLSTGKQEASFDINFSTLGIAASRLEPEVPQESVVIGEGPFWIKIRNLQDGKESFSRNISIPTQWLGVPRGGKTVVCGCDDGKVRLLSIETSKIRILEGPPYFSGIAAVGVAADGQRIAAATMADQNLYVWDLSKEETPHLIRLGDEADAMTCAAIAADSGRAVTGHRNGSVAVWDLWNRRRLAAHATHKGPVAVVAISADGMQILSAGTRDLPLRLRRLTEDPVK